MVGDAKKIGKEEFEEIQTKEEGESEESSWWIQLLFTLLCLASVGTLSLARCIVVNIAQWFNGRRVHVDVNRRATTKQRKEEGVQTEGRESSSQPEEPQHEEDDEKVRMQWNIVLEAALAEQAEQIKVLKEDEQMC